MATRVVFLGELGARFGRDHVLIGDDGLTLGDVRRLLIDQVEGCGPHISQPNVRLMVDQVIVPEDTRVRPDQEVAVLPIYSGG